MKTLNQYISSAGTSAQPSAADVEALYARYPWCSSLRVLLTHISGTSDPIAELFAEGRGASSLSRLSIDIVFLDNSHIIHRSKTLAPPLLVRHRKG